MLLSRAVFLDQVSPRALSFIHEVNPFFSCSRVLSIDSCALTLDFCYKIYSVLGLLCMSLGAEPFCLSIVTVIVFPMWLPVKKAIVLEPRVFSFI